MPTTPKIKPLYLIWCALFATITAVLSQIVVPIGPIPINLATFSVLTVGAILGKKMGAVSQLVYVLLGAVGIPVFSMFRAGLGVLLGPTGGYIIGYIAGAWVVGLLAEKSSGKIHLLALAMLGGFATYMLLGTAWYMFLTKSTLLQALLTCVVPFLLGDMLKVAGAALLAHRLRPLVQDRMKAV